MSNISELVSFLKEAALGIESPPEEEVTLIDKEVLEIAIDTTLKETKGHLVDDTEFEELVIINLIIESSKKGYSTEDIRGFVSELAGDKKDG